MCPAPAENVDQFETSYKDEESNQSYTKDELKKSKKSKPRNARGGKPLI